MKGSKGKGPHDAGQATKVYNHMTNGKPAAGSDKKAPKGGKKNG